MNIAPFEYVKMRYDEDCPFIQNVKSVLSANLQLPDAFGCKIMRCHTHAGSKIHFENFVEAELLFHNNYYNYGFAFLTVENIIKHMKSFDKKETIILISYESFSELYLQEVKGMLLKEGYNCEYCIYESVVLNNNTSERIITQRIRNLYHDSDYNSFVKYGFFHNEDEKHIIKFDETLFVFVVPVNTSLSTMDKMISLFSKEIGISQNNVEFNLCKNNTLLQCLITIAPCNNENIYWQAADGLLIPDARFNDIRKIKDIAVNNFATINSEWMYVKHNENSTEKNLCKYCYPDIVTKTSSSNKKTLTDEEPIFDVTRASIVPMLQLGKSDLLIPLNKNNTFINDEIYKKELQNLERVQQISKYMIYHHIKRGENHYQYYIDTTGFLNEYENTIINDLDQYKSEIKERNHCNPDKKIVYNYIVSPRHETNAKWINLVYSKLFANDNIPDYNGARILYFDVSKEYRSNFIAKYSDFRRVIENIIKSHKEYEIRFHYVDDTIASGNNFIRSANLIKSLIESINISENERLDFQNKAILFYSIILLYSRSSHNTKNFYLKLFKNTGLINKNTEYNFYKYVNINIPHMRNYEDACTLCKIISDYNYVLKECATNELSQQCSDTINAHLPISDLYFKSANLLIPTNKEKQLMTEKKYLFVILHILNQRFLHDNRPLFMGEKYFEQIDTESEAAPVIIEDILNDYYQNLRKKYCSNYFSDEDNYKNAFIKAISRPFFTFYLRRRQASFSFCLKLLNEQLNNNNKKKDLRLIKTLVKALSDMNSNFLIRKEPFDKLCFLADNSLNMKGDEGKYSAQLFCMSIKKMISLSQDPTKSLLLEYNLIKNTEDGFFKSKRSSVENDEKYKLSDALTIPCCENGEGSCERVLNTRGIIYLENNKILVGALKDLVNNNNIYLNSYFFDNFKELLEVYGILNIRETRSYSNEKNFNLNEFIKAYSDVKKDIESNTIIDQNLIKLVNSIRDNKDNNDWIIYTFIRDLNVTNNKEDFNKIFEYLHFCDNTDNNLNSYKLFYNDSNFKTLRNYFTANYKNNINDVVFIKNEETQDHSIVICFKNNKSTRNNLDESIYMQIINFKIDDPLHWFRLKILLTLRHMISELIKRINLSEYIIQRHNYSVQRSLSTPKALNHSNIDENMTVKFNNGSGYGIFGMLQAKESSDIFIKRLYFKYLTSIANETLASWYRKIIRSYPTIDEQKIDGQEAKEGIISFNTEKTPSDALPILEVDNYQPWDDNEIDYTIQDSLKHLFGASTVENSCPEDNTKLRFEYRVFNSEEKNRQEIVLDVNVKVKNSNHKNFKIKNISINGQPNLKSAFYLILILLLNNIVEHSKNTNSVDLVFNVDKKTIEVKNRIDKNQDDIKVNNINVSDTINIMPIFRGERKSMTLWTLSHLFKNNNWIKAGFYDPENDNTFVVTFNDFLEWEEEKNEKE